MKSYTVKEVADLLKVDPETVRRWIRDKKLAAEKTSNKGGNKILESELKAFIKATPKYAISSAAILTGGIAASTIMLATYAAGKAIELSEIKNAKVDSGALVDFIRGEIASREALILKKCETIHQIEDEISIEQENIDKLKAMIQDFEITSVSEGRKSDG